MTKISKPFSKIGLFTKTHDLKVEDTFLKLINYLKENAYTIFVESQSAKLLEDKTNIEIKSKEKIASFCDLIIITGGDGSLLNAARAIVDYNVPILGINTGKLGFLADIRPLNLDKMLKTIMQGIYEEEERTLLSTQVIRENKEILNCKALNDIVMHSASIARMIEFEIFIDERFVLKQKSDGIIAATPTGSTAYALSGGGPILYPTINAFCLVPMFPHTLSNRPLVIKDSSIITINVTEKELKLNLSFDGQEHFELKYNDKIVITKHKNHIKLLHPKGYNYFDVLREKLGWNVFNKKTCNE